MMLTFLPTRPEKSPEQLYRELILSGFSHDVGMRAADHLRDCRLYIDTTSTYQVDVRPVNPSEHSLGPATLWHLSIARVDREPIGDWRVKQAIKNAILNEDCEAVELYPAEARLVDHGNFYHLWGFREPVPDGAFPFGLRPHLGWPMLHRES